MDKKEAFTIFRALILSHSAGKMKLSEFEKQFQKVEETKIPLFGYANIISLLMTTPNEFEVMLKDGEAFISAKKQTSYQKSLGSKMRYTMR